MKSDMIPAVNGKIIELNRAYRGYIPCDWTADVFERISASQMVREHNTKLLGSLPQVNQWSMPMLQSRCIPPIMFGATFCGRGLKLWPIILPFGDTHWHTHTSSTSSMDFLKLRMDFWFSQAQVARNWRWSSQHSSLSSKPSEGWSMKWRFMGCFVTYKNLAVYNIYIYMGEMDVMGYLMCTTNSMIHGYVSKRGPYL